VTDEPPQRRERHKLAIFSIGLELLSDIRQVALGKYEGRAERMLAFNLAESFYATIVPLAMAEKQATDFHPAMRNAPIPVVYKRVDFVKGRKGVKDLAGPVG
jgi:hypothetical protein